MNPIAEFTASVANVKTMADGSPRFTFDAPEKEVSLLSTLAEAKLQGKALYIVVYDMKELDKEAKNLTGLDYEAEQSPQGTPSIVHSGRVDLRRNK